MHPDRALYDVIVVGARAAGAATAMLLARHGLRVLVVDRSRYGADTLSTHALMRGGVLQLHRWGLLDRVVEAGTPPIRRTTFDYGGEDVVITIKPSYGVDALYAPRRTVLDPILVDAAAAAGAEVRYGITVTDVRRDDHGRVCGIVGRDEHGRSARRRLRRSWSAPTASARPSPTGSMLRSNEPVPAPPQSSTATGPASRPTATSGSTGPTPGRDHPDQRRPGVRVRRGHPSPHRRGRGRRAPRRPRRGGAGRRCPRRRRHRAARRAHLQGRPGLIRRSWGPGWALVGDAGYWKDPISAHGLTDALRDAELLARAITVTEPGTDDRTEALAEYQATRDRLSRQLFDVTDTIAAQHWTADEIPGLLMQLSSAMADEVETLAALDAVVVA